MAKESTKISASIRAVSLVRSLFEHIHGNLGVLKFSIEELKPTNGSPRQNPKNGMSFVVSLKLLEQVLQLVI